MVPRRARGRGRKQTVLNESQKPEGKQQENERAAAGRKHSKETLLANKKEPAWGSKP